MCYLMKMRLRWRDRVIDLSNRRVEAPGLPEPLVLSANEVALLEGMLAGGGGAVSREQLRGVLGISPTVQSRALHHAITRLRAKIGVGCIETVRGLGYRLKASPKTELLGREGLLAELALRRKAPLVTLVGPGGIGKTALARDWAGDARFIDLGPTQTPWDVLWTVGWALGCPPRAHDQEKCIEQMAETQGAGDVLFLDNAEHVQEAVATLVRALLLRGVRVRCTSRVPLGVEDEVVVPVGPLDPYSAAELYERSLGSEVARADQELLDALEGIPLALELAANRRLTLSARDLFLRLRSDPGLLSRQESEDPRHRTMATVFEVSWRLLSVEEQSALSQLTVFGGPFDLDAAQAVIGPNTVNTLDALVRQSLVQPIQLPNGGLQYRLFEVLRTMAAERLTESSRQLAEARHLAYFGQLAAELSASVPGPDGDQALRMIRSHYAGLQAAVRRCEGRGMEHVVSILEALHHLGVQHSAVVELSLVEQAYAAAQSDELRARLLVIQSALLYRNQLIDRAAKSSALALSLAQSPRVVVEAQLGCATAQGWLGNKAAAHAHVEAALAVAESADLRALQAAAHLTLAVQAQRGASLEQAETHLLLVLQLCPKCPYPMALALTGLARTYQVLRRYEEAAACAEEARLLLGRLEDHYTQVVVSETAAKLMLLTGDLDGAERAFLDAEAGSRRAGNALVQGYFKIGLALVALHRGHPHSARGHAARAALHHRRTGSRWPEVGSLLLAALSAGLEEDAIGARAFLDRALGLLHASDPPAPLLAKAGATQVVLAVLCGSDASSVIDSSRQRGSGEAEDLLSLAEAWATGSPTTGVSSLLGRAVAASRPAKNELSQS